MLAAARSQATPMPAIEATFSVPARRPRSWWPPTIRGRILVPLRTYKAPTPLGACSLWPERENRSTVEDLQVQRQLARRLHPVHMEDRAVLLDDCPDGLGVEDHPGLVVGHHDRDDGGVLPQGPAEFVQVQMAGLVDPEDRSLRSRGVFRDPGTGPAPPDVPRRW